MAVVFLVYEGCQDGTQRGQEPEEVVVVRGMDLQMMRRAIEKEEVSAAVGILFYGMAGMVVGREKARNAHPGVVSPAHGLALQTVTIFVTEERVPDVRRQ